MRIKNYTNIPTALIRKIVRLVKPSGVSNFDVMVKNSKYRFCGRAYPRGSGYHDSANPFVVARITSHADIFPLRTLKPRGGYLGGFLLLSKEEALVYILAHELRHLAQHNRNCHKVYGAKGRVSERDADAYAIRKVREYRRGVINDIV